MSLNHRRGETYAEYKARREREGRNRAEEYARLMANAVRRDPCFKCGTRADIGCIHSQVAA